MAEERARQAEKEGWEEICALSTRTWRKQLDEQVRPVSHWYNNVTMCRESLTRHV